MGASETISGSVRRHVHAAATGLLLTAAALSLWPGPARASDPVSTWLDDLARCIPTKPLRLAIVGFEPGVLQQYAEQVRLSLQGDIQRQHPGRVEIAAARDIGRLRHLRYDIARPPADEGNRQLQQAFLAVDAVVFFSQPRREPSDPSSLKFRLQAVLPNNPGCTATSLDIERRIDVGPAVADVDSRIRGAVAALLDRHESVRSVTVCPFETAGKGFSTCAPILTDKVSELLAAERSTGSHIIRDRVLRIERGAPGACSAPEDGVTTHGEVGHEGRERSWMKLEFRRGAELLALTGRFQIVPEDLGCEPASRSFLDHVVATAKADPERLVVKAAKPAFARDDFLDIAITSKHELALYCWVLAADESAFVALPLPGREASARTAAGRSRRYPGDDFGTMAVQLQQASEDLFGCFGVPGPLPPELHERWLRHAPRAGQPAAEIGRDEVLALMDALRSQPQVVESYTRIVVR